MIREILSLPGKILGLIINSTIFEKLISNPFLATFLLIAIVVLGSFPSYDVAINAQEMHDSWATIFLQAKDPFLHHDNLYASGSHGEKLAFRFVPAVILGMLHIDSIIPALIFQFFTLIVFYCLLVQLFNKLFIDTKKAFLYALPFCFVVSGHVYVSDYRGIFDTIALDFLLLALLFRNKIYVIIPLLLAYFTDERALIASPALFLINVFYSDNYKNFKSIFNEILHLNNLYLFISWMLYFAIRATLHFTLGLTSGTGADCFLFLDQINKTFYTLYVGFEAFIIPFVLVLIYLLKNKNITYALLIILSFALVFFIAQSVIDINRSMSYMLLILILTVILLDRFYPKEYVFKIIALVILINIVYDDYYPFLAQLYRMKFITHSI